ncbi:MAG: glycosyltransferase [Hydrogenophaga sp.]|uniref:glycosyltransferase n=1 Tax=Hydrogenophaga sp. TaxID=1904254 RepID=UPI003D0DACA9
MTSTPSALPRVLMVAFHFPPQAGSSGILRTLNFVKYLPQSGWRPSVLTAHPRAYEERSDNLLRNIPPDTQVSRAFALDAARHLSLAGKYPRWFALPDRWSSWWLGGVVQGWGLVRTLKPSVVWSTYPIATAHWIGGTLARWSGLPWVADFRDPMVSAGAPSDPRQRRAFERIEAHAMRHAAACVFTTARAAAEYGRRYPDAAGRCHVIENGYDDAAFDGLQPERFGTPPDKLLMLHSGLIYPRDRDPSTFFAAIRSLINRGTLAADKLCIRFRAPQHADEVRACARAHGLEDALEIAPPVAYGQALAEMMAADLLLVFQGSHFNAQIPAKIYEYLRAGRSLMAVVDPAGDTAAQLRQFEGVYVVDMGAAQTIDEALTRWHADKDAAPAVEARRNNLRLVEKYSRSAQAAVLARILDQVAPARTH